MKTSMIFLLRFRSYRGFLCLLFLLPWSRAVLADTHYVSTAGGNVSPYTTPANAARGIQSAVDTASDGDTVSVAAGTYGGNITVSKRVTIRGAGTSQTIVDGNDSTPCFSSLAANAVVSGMTITKGRAPYGGGVTGGIVSNCVLTANTADMGGGVYQSTLHNCTLSANHSEMAAGAYQSTLYNCLLTGNTCHTSGGGAFESTLYNCLLTRNSADSAGGAYESTLYNCTISRNSSASYLSGTAAGTLYNCICYPDSTDSTLNHSCTTNPKFVGVGNFAINSGSPCIGAADPATATAYDILGVRRVVPDIGAYEFVTNQVPPPAVTHYVSLTGGNVAPYTNEATAARTIQAAVDVAEDGNTVRVAAGTYSGGISFALEVTVRGAGAGRTIVDGNNNVRCFNLSGVAVVADMTITRGKADFGGGVTGGIVSNCVLTANYADMGGAARGSTLYNCVVTGNSTRPDGGQGGGVIESTLYNCLLTGNSAFANGAAVMSTLYNCTISGNSCVEQNSATGAGGCTLYNCISYPDFSYETWGNCWTTDPKFVGGGDYSLRPDSPCINAADAASATTTDILGNSRVIPDIGTYEFASRQGDVMAGYTFGDVLGVTVKSVAPRTRSNLIDVDYVYTNSQPHAAEIRGFAYAADAVVSDLSTSRLDYAAGIYRIVTLVEGTATNYGVGVMPRTAPRRLTWDAGADIGYSVQNMKIQLVATEANVLPLSLHFVTIPASGPDPALTISRYAGVMPGDALNRALLYATCRGWATNSGPRLYAVGGACNGQQIFSSPSVPTEPGKQWLCEKLGGGIRLATAAEVKRAQEATTPGTVAKRTSYWWVGSRVMLVNEYGIETGVSSAWYFVKP